MDSAEILAYTLLGLGAALAYTLIYRAQWCSVAGLRERALEAADEGDSARMLSLLARLERKEVSAPGERAAFAASLVLMACEYGHPATAEVAMRHFGLTADQLVFEDGQSLAEFAREGSHEAVIVFLNAHAAQETGLTSAPAPC